MTPGDLDRILQSDDVLEPSSGFVAGVMDAVRREAQQPASVAFPWARFVLGLAASGLMAAAATALFANFSEAFASALAPLATVTPEIGYAVAALVVTFVFIFLPRVLSRY
jgi:hypothetical protein